MKFSVLRPTTFFTSDTNVLIRDAKGTLFYTHTNSRRRLTFNLPYGTYITSNYIEEQDHFEPYPFIDAIDMPSIEVQGRDIKAIVTDNPNKATIYPEHGIILIDHKINNLNYRPAKSFVVGHELGHHYYSSDESACDYFAYNIMMRAGYNPSQVYIAAKMLFQNNPGRKNGLIEKIKNLNTRR
jgi:hypothetical protein